MPALSKTLRRLTTTERIQVVNDSHGVIGGHKSVTRHINRIGLVVPVILADKTVEMVHWAVVEHGV